MISAKTVTDAAERVATADPAQTQTMINLMKREQPYVLVYLAAISEREEFSENELDAFFHAGVVVWQLMRQTPIGRHEITERRLKKAEKANEALLRKMGSD